MPTNQAAGVSCVTKQTTVSQGLSGPFALSQGTVKRKISYCRPQIVLPKEVLLAIQNHAGLSLTDFQIPQDFEQDDRPVIAVIFALWAPNLSNWAGQSNHDLAQQALATIRQLGGRPVVVDSSSSVQQAAGTSWQQEVDAFVFLGGADVHPGFYTAGDPSQSLPGIDANADKFCLDSIRRAVDEDRPVLGICRGSQLINVAQGGTLVQHIEGHRKDIGNGDMDFIDEKVELVGSTKIAELLKRDTMDVRSSHHQTIDQTGDGLMVAAYAHDNSIEAVEHRDKTWVVGLQWHPEEGSANADHRQLLFEAVIRHAQRQKDQKLVLQQ